jgi:hypothetical protein
MVTNLLRYEVFGVITVGVGWRILASWFLENVDIPSTELLVVIL